MLGRTLLIASTLVVGGFAATGASAHLRPHGYIQSDVDVYNKPGGRGRVIGMLRTGAERSFFCKPDNWCRVRDGWIWGDFIDFQKPWKNSGREQAWSGGQKGWGKGWQDRGDYAARDGYDGGWKGKGGKWRDEEQW